MVIEILDVDLLLLSFTQEIKDLAAERDYAASKGRYEKAARYDIQIEAFEKAKRIVSSGDYHIEKRCNN